MNQQLINKYDSEFCGKLPIHLINVVQPYGALMVIDRSGPTVIQVSENMQAVTGRPLASIPGTPASDYFDIGYLNTVKDPAPFMLNVSGRKYMAILHHQPAYHLLEINLESSGDELEGSFINVYQELRHAITAIENATTVSEVAAVAALELKKASGFDKVMIYRFDESWNGFVMAEKQEEDMESYLGFTFPASDIPRQAREMYLKNTYRFIPDRDYKPVKLYPFINPATNGFIDLSDCNVRGVSTVHLEYLKNMNVAASMSTRIIKDDKLWGLIACHNRTAMKVDYKMCAVFELLSGIISTRTASLESKEKHSFETNLSTTYTSLVEDTYRTADLPNSLLSSSKNILELLNASGSVITYKGETHTKGSLPDASSMEDLLLWLNSRDAQSVYHTDNLSREYDYASDFRDVASGLMVIPIDSEKEEYILLFRPEVIQTISWGGNPERRINFEPDLKTYHPRFSFKLWQEKVSGTSMPWRPEEIDMAENLRQFIKDFIVRKD